MLKDYLKEKNLSMYKVSKESGVPYSTLNDLVNGRVKIDSCKVSLFLHLSQYLGISMDQLYSVITDGVIEGQNPTNTEISKAKGAEAKEEIIVLPDFEKILNDRLAPEEYIGKSVENKKSLLELMAVTAKKDDENDFDHLRRICKKGKMPEDLFRKGLAYIIMTDYILAQQGRSVENVFIETDANGALRRFVLPESTGNVLFLKQDVKNDNIENLDISFLKKKERKLLKLVADKDIINKEKLLTKEELEKLLSESNLPAKKIKKVCTLYQKRLSLFMLWLDE